MPDITYNVSFVVSKGHLNNSVSASGITADMAAPGLVSQTITLSTNAVSIQTAQFSSAGLAFLQNVSTSTAQTVTVGIEAGGSFVGMSTLRAGEPAVFRMSTGTDYKVTGSPGSRIRVDVTEG